MTLPWTQYPSARATRAGEQRDNCLLAVLAGMCEAPHPVTLRVVTAATVQRIKPGLPAFGGFTTTNDRRNSSISGVTYCVLDFDDISENQLDQIMSDLDGLNWLVYTTIKHQILGQGNRIRAVLPLSRTLAPSEWARYRIGLQRRFPLADPNALKLSQIAFSPVLLNDTSDFWWDRSDGGSPLNVDALLEGIPEQAETPKPARDWTETITRDMVDPTIGRLRRSKSARQKALSKALTDALDGVPHHIGGHYEPVVFDLLGELSRDLRDASGEALAGIFQDAWENDDRDFADLVDKATRQIDRTEAIDPAPEQGGETAPEITAPGRTKANTFILRFASSQAIRYLTRAGSYADGVMSALPAIVRTDMRDMGLSATVQTDKGERDKSPEDLLKQYGSPINYAIVDHTATRTRITDECGLTVLSENVRRASITPKQHPDIGDWLSLLDTSDQILDWLAQVTRCDLQLPILTILGPSGIGKSVLAAGLAAIWGTVGKMGLVLDGRHGDVVLQKTPLIVADEALPRDGRGRVPTEAIRDLVTAHARQTNPKNQALVEVRGYLRLMFLANKDRDLGDFGRDSNAEDLDAVASRFLVLDRRGDDSAAQYLATRRERIPAWVASEIAEHTAWLAETREIKRAGRFGFGDAKPTTGMLAGGHVRLVLEWLVRAISGGQRGDIELDGDNIVFTTSTAVRGLQRLDVGRLTAAQVAAATAIFPASGGRTLVSVDRLRAWVLDARYITPGDLDAALAEFRKPAEFGKPAAGASVTRIHG